MAEAAPGAQGPPSIVRRLWTWLRPTAAQVGRGVRWIWRHRGWPLDWLDRRRGNPLAWLAFAILGLYLAFQLGEWLYCNKPEWLSNPGPWTLLGLVAGAPLAWYVWFIRDRNKAADLFQKDVEQAWSVFRQLQEWATKEENDVLQAAAIHQLAPFILGRAEGFLPQALVSKDNPFAQPGLAILRALLDDRRWLTRWEQRQTEGRDAAAGGGTPQAGVGRVDPSRKWPRSPVLLAIEGMVRDEALPTREFSEWNLSALRLGGVQWAEAVLHETNLSGAWLWHANLSGAWLWHANLSGAHLEGANLSGARLGNAKLSGAELGGAQIDAKWRAAEEFKVEYLGAPLWIEEEQGAGDKTPE